MDTRSLYEKDMLCANRVKLLSRLSVAFTVAVVFPSIVVLLMALSWIFSILIWFLLLAIAFVTLFFVFMNEGYVNAWGWALNVSENATSITGRILDAYMYIMPVFAAAVIAFGVLAIIFGKKHEELPGAKGAFNTGIASITIMVMGVVAYIVIMSFAGGTGA